MKKIASLIFIIFYCISFVSAHVINYELDKASDVEVFQRYFWIGFQHILPLGFDHILFITCVFFLNTTIRSIILQASMFTLAHSITLALAAYGVIKPPLNIIEPLIALSIVFLAVENIFSQKVRPWRLAMVFLFGLIHGMGFAGALSELGMPTYSYASALISFNLGVELGQISVILVLYFFIAKWFKGKIWYHKKIVVPLSLIIAFIAALWTVERMLIT